MNSRERVLSTINHREPDRVPVDFGAMRSTGIMAIAYNRLKRALGFDLVPTRMYDLVQQLAYPDPEVLDRFGVDAVDPGNLLSLDISAWKDWRLPDGGLCKVPGWFDPAYNEVEKRLEVYHPDGELIGVMPEGCLYFEQAHYPLADGRIPDTTDELAAASEKNVWSRLSCSPWDRSDDADFWTWLGKSLREVRDSTDRAIMLAFGGNLLESGQFLCSAENFLLMLAAEPNKAEKLLDLLVEMHLEKLEKTIRAAGDSVDIIQMGDDLGMQAGLQISPEMYRRFFKPRHENIYRYIKDNSQMHVFLHSCGSLYEILGDLVDVGVDIINPVQTSAVGMEPEKLKTEFGKHLTFWGGGCDTQTVLGKASPREVTEHVKKRIDILAPGGGFVFNQVHNVMADVPPENVIAMFDAVHKYGGY